MTSRVSVKQSKNARPRSSDKLRKGKRDGTPEKPTTPNASQEGFEEDQPQKDVIINDEIRALQVKPEDLAKIREPRPPSGEKRTSPRPCSVVVRKLKPASEWDRPKPKVVTVAKPAPPDADLKPIEYSGAAGPRFDHEGYIIPHSILGSVDDFKREAETTGELHMDIMERPQSRSEGQLSVKYEKKETGYPKFESAEESNALKNWEKRMRERKRQQGYLSKLLNKPPDQLVMNQADTYRQTQELRYLIDRTISTKDYGKGYRVGSEFWKQQERIGGDITGMHMTLSQTEKGYPPPIEHVGVPRKILAEKGSHWDRPKTPCSKPWHKTQYLKERREQLQSVMAELDPHQPEILGLEISGGKPAFRGGNEDRLVMDDEGMSETDEMKQEYQEMNKEIEDPLSNYPDVRPAPVYGPSLKFAGQPAQWTGDSSSFEGQVGIEARVSFEAFSAKRVTSYLDIVNNGTTCIYYDWKKITKTNPFDIPSAKVQRFYFNTSNGVILPGDTMKFPFIFKSPNAGVFNEQWQFQTRPVVCGGAALLVTLRGVALQEDKYQDQRNDLEDSLEKKQAEQIVKGILESILDGIREPERPRSPIDAYITEEEIFNRLNPGKHYSKQTVDILKELYKERWPEEEREDKEWDLNIQTIQNEIMNEMDEDDDRKQELLMKLNTSVISLSLPPFTPQQQKMATVCYSLLTDLVDQIVGGSMQLRTALGMPELEGSDLPDEPKTPEKGASRRTSTAGRKMSITPSVGDSAPSDSKRSGSKGKADSKDKKGAAKDAKGAKSKDSAKGGKATTPVSGAKRPSTREKDPDAAAPMSGSQSPLPSSGDPILEAKFKEKLYSMAYSVLNDTFTKVDQVFQEIKSRPES